MKLIRQKCSLAIDNIGLDQLNNTRKHSELLPSSIRCIISGPSGSGKTNVMINLLEDINGLRYENVYIYAKSLYQPKYVYLRKLYSQLASNIEYHEFSSDTDIMHPSDAKENSIFIFDDVSSQKQSVIRDYFSMGRHRGIDSFYLCQTYAHVGKHQIRDNCNLIIVFKTDDLNLNKIFSDHVHGDVSFKVFKEMASMCWADKHGFLVIDKDSDLDKGRYRKGFDFYIKTS